MDFAGSGVVHVTGGVCALIGCIFIGPRMGRFEDGKVIAMPGHSVTLAGLGGFILLFGFLAFNAGSQVSGGTITIYSQILWRFSFNFYLSISCHNLGKSHLLVVNEIIFIFFRATFQIQMMSIGLD